MATTVIGLAPTAANGTSGTRIVPAPAASNTPGLPGDRFVDGPNGQSGFYTGDGVSNHTWAYNEIVTYPPVVK